MSDQFIGEIRPFAGNFAPLGWAMCNGQLLPIAQNTALFSILGVNFGGDGKLNFALPNLQGRVPLGAGQGPGLSQRTLGQPGGEASVTLVEAQLPAHSHPVLASPNAANSGLPTANVPALSLGHVYGQPTHLVPMSSRSVDPSGNGLPHNNLQPYQVVNFIIALQGIFPPRA